MKFFITLAALIAVCIAAPLESDVAATSISDNRVINAEGYNFDFETSNGIKRQEGGELKQFEDLSAIVVSGSVSWTAPNGELIEVKYTADESGYHPIVS